MLLRSLVEMLSPGIGYVHLLLFEPWDRSSNLSECLDEMGCRSPLTRGRKRQKMTESESYRWLKFLRVSSKLGDKRISDGKQCKHKLST